MRRVRRHGKSKSQRGASLVEYCMLVALIAVAAMSSVRFVGTETKCLYGELGNRVGQSNGGSGFVPFSDPDCESGNGHDFPDLEDGYHTIESGNGYYAGPGFGL